MSIQPRTTAATGPGGDPYLPDAGRDPTPAIQGGGCDQGAAPLDRRRQAYLEERVDDQSAWYSKKAHNNNKRGRHLTLCSDVLVLLGLLFGLARALSLVDLELLGLFTAAGSAAAWAQVRQHRTLAASYGTAAQETHPQQAVARCARTIVLSTDTAQSTSPAASA